MGAAQFATELQVKAFRLILTGHQLGRRVTAEEAGRTLDRPQSIGVALTGLSQHGWIEYPAAPDAPIIPLRDARGQLL